MAHPSHSAIDRTPPVHMAHLERTLRVDSGRLAAEDGLPLATALLA
jgi:hypothetical protein